MTGLVLADVGIALFFILLYAWIAVMAALSVGSAAMGAGMFGNIGLIGQVAPCPITRRR